MGEPTTERAPRKKQTPRDTGIALELIEGATAAEAARKYEVSTATVSRIRSSDWYAELEKEMLEDSVAAARRVLRSRAANVARRLVTIALDTKGDTRLRETARKACLDALAAAGINIGPGKEAPPSSAQAPGTGVLIAPAPMTTREWIEANTRN